LVKKICNIIIALLLVVSTSGITVYKHYCGSKLRKYSIIFEPTSCCKGPCKKCHTDGKLLKVKDNFEAQNLLLKTQNLNLKTLLPIHYFPLAISFSNLNTSNVLNLQNFNQYFAYCQPRVCPLTLTEALRL
jgi:hypothetical protein